MRSFACEPHHLEDQRRGSEAWTVTRCFGSTVLGMAQGRIRHFPYGSPKEGGRWPNPPPRADTSRGHVRRELLDNPHDVEALAPVRRSGWAAATAATASAPGRRAWTGERPRWYVRAVHQH
jgi:hypothetical protein